MTGYLGFRGGSVVKKLPAVQETWVQSLGGEGPLEKEMAAHSSIVAWKSHGQRSLAGCSPWGCKESDTTEQLHFHFQKERGDLAPYILPTF